MPSPIAHMAAGYMIHRIYSVHRPESDPKSVGRVPLSMVAALGLSILPDTDSVAGSLTGDLGRFHNGWTHSLIVGLCASAIVGTYAWFRRREMSKAWFWITLLSYELHVMMDFFTIGRGVQALWPFSAARYASPIRIFYGLHWSEGWLSIRHLWTLITELGFLFLVYVSVHISNRFKFSMRTEGTDAAH